MISDSLTIMIVIAFVFLSGAYIGQLIFKLRLARLEKENLQLGQKRMTELKELLSAKNHSSRRRRHRSPSPETDKAIQDEIDDILGEIEGK